jgi:hypothetical protein
MMAGKSPSPEDSRVLEWLRIEEDLIPVPVHQDPSFKESSSPDVFWVHLPDSSAYLKWRSGPACRMALDSLTRNGARVLFTGYAALLPHELGIETVPPSVDRLPVREDWLFDKKGLQSWRGHPVFAGLFGGAFLFDGFRNDTLPRVGYFSNRFPREGRIVAVEKSYITVHRTRRLMTEYETDGSGRLLSVGGLVYFDRSNRLRAHCRAFLKNCFFYLNERIGDQEKRTYWKQGEEKTGRIDDHSPPLEPSSLRHLPDLPQSTLYLSSDSAGANFFDLAGRRALVMGKERGGIDELWVHPFRILRDYRAGVVADDTVAWLDTMPVRIVIRPESVTRWVRTPWGEVQEIIYPSLDKAGALVHYRSSLNADLKLLITFRSDLRWMWPYDEFSTGSPVFGYDEGLNALHIRDEAGEFACIFGGDTAPLAHLEGTYEKVEWKEGRLAGKGSAGNQVAHGAVFSLSGDQDRCLNLALAGTCQGPKEADAHYRGLLSHPEEEYARLVAHVCDLLDRSVTLETPDEEFNRYWKWALVGTDRFWARTPSLGEALVAGYATSDRGWGGGHRNSGRPGYGWYFGRDAAWSGFAVDDYGDFQGVKNQLQFFRKFQDLSGKIFHELSSSGVVHYDAADATPLFVILAAHYLRASGDVPFIRRLWHSVERAMNFLYGTDTDGDALIENTQVGHGWVEGGKLWGAHTTFYLAGLWTRTLEDAAYLAFHTGHEEVSLRYSRDAAKVREILNRDFWNEEEQFFYYGKMADGSFHTEKTVLPAVLMHFDLLDEEKAGPVLETYAGNGFSSDWGVRILGSQSPLFNPSGYHYGSVWPLFTGWTSLAEYRYGNSGQGFTHLCNNLHIKRYWARGFVEEVMNGAVFQPSGVCPHQCWSETNVLHPGISGMIGWAPEAPEKSAVLKPRFPPQWERVRVFNLRAGTSLMDLEVEQGDTETRYSMTLKEGPGITVRLYPRIRIGMRVSEAILDGRNLNPERTVSRGIWDEPVEVKLKERSVLMLRHQGGAGLLPLEPRPEPGDSSLGLRILSQRVDGNRLIVDLEGPAGRTGSFPLRLFGTSPGPVRGAGIEKIPDGALYRLLVSFPESPDLFSRKRVEIGLEP